jgi:peptide/nickel transport system permease protein
MEADKTNSILSKSALFGVGILLLTAILAPLITPHNPDEINAQTVLLPPNAEFWFGTDNLGRCVFSRVLAGTQTSLLISLTVVGVSGIFGTFLGLTAAVFDNFGRRIILKLIDVFLIIPGLIFSLIIAGLLGTGNLNLIIALVVVGWVRFAKTSYTIGLSVKEAEFVTAATAMGASRRHIIFRHLFPNVLPSLLIIASLSMGYTILSIAALSFLGIGIQPPTPEWGAMLYNSRNYFSTAPHLAIFPGTAIFLTTFVFLALGKSKSSHEI